MTGPSRTIAAPTPSQERIEILDVLRGFALFGVLLMNMQYFVSPSYLTILQSEGATAADWLGFWFVRVFAESKFYPLFSASKSCGPIPFLGLFFRLRLRSKRRWRPSAPCY